MILKRVSNFDRVGIAPSVMGALFKNKMKYSEEIKAAQLKRSVYGCYHSVSDKHLQNYIDESVFRYNTREISEELRFNAMLSRITKHLTYKQLTHDITSSNHNASAQPNLFSEQAEC